MFPRPSRLSGRDLGTGRRVSAPESGVPEEGWALLEYCSFGAANGSFAEYACARQENIVAKPKDLTFAQAATIPMAGTTALQALRNKGRVEADQHVLINGAAGGVGTFAVQIAKALGAEVTGVCSTGNVDRVRSIGADHVIDYTVGDFASDARRYDVMIDNAGSRSLSDCRLVTAGKVTPVIEQSYQLFEVPEAIRRVGTGHAKGKLVITV